MKNKNLVSSGLLLLIIVLIGIAGSYYYFNIDNFKKNEVNSSNEVDKNNNQTQTPNKNDPQKDPSQKSNVKKITTYADFQMYSNRQENTFFVFGRSGCHFCEMYLPVLDSVSSEYNIEIIYLDFSKFSEADYKAVMHSELSIPSKCTTSGEETPLSSGFGTPLSLFVNGNKSYDCIRGYKDKNNLIEQLQSIGYIE